MLLLLLLNKIIALSMFQEKRTNALVFSGTYRHNLGKLECLWKEQQSIKSQNVWL